MDFAAIIYNVAALLGIVAFGLNSILWLRIVFTLSTLLLVIAGILFNIKSMIIWNIFYSAVNITQVIIYLINNTELIIPSEFQAIYYHVFKSLTTREFLSLIKLGQIKEEANTLFCKNGDTLNVLYLILTGRAKVIKQGGEETILNEGQLIGEMRFIGRQPMSAEVRAQGPIRYVVWKYETLEKIQSTKPELFNKILIILGKDLIQKIYESNKNL